MASTYITKQGDMWDSIAYSSYGDEYQINLLMEANPKHIETVIFSAGIQLTIPDLPSGTVQNLPPWKKKT